MVTESPQASITTDEDLVNAAEAWIRDDPDPDSRKELQDLLDSCRFDEVRDRMSAALQFGTAGLRGVVGAGPNRMNRAVVIRTTCAVAQYVRDRVPDGRTLPVVVGFDARTTSRRFAEDVVEVLVAAGLTVRDFRSCVPTPLVAYAAKQLGASVAIVVTASHNPPEYNGYKVFGSNAAQIVPPVDAAIAARIEKVGSAKDVRRASGVLAGGNERVEPVPESLVDRYFADIEAVRPKGAADRDFTIVYTPLHGVGWRYVRRGLALAGYERVVPVPEQSEPDGRFPTVRFPNPEEEGAMSLAVALADREGAELVLANDPDADRLAVAVPTPTGRWKQLTGNQVGLLLADYLLAATPSTPTRSPLVVSSIVSSPMLRAIAAARGARFEQTLTGFKWICNAAMALEASEGLRFVFGYEEALGYSVGRIVRDKDGISAAVVFADLAARCRAVGSTVLERLRQLYLTHGLWVSEQRNVVREAGEGRAQMMSTLKKLCEEPPGEVGGRKVIRVVDFARGAESRPTWLPQADLVLFELEGGGRVLVRPSGTEPKMKIYVDLEFRVAVGDVASVEKEGIEQARDLAQVVADRFEHG